MNGNNMELLCYLKNNLGQAADVIGLITFFFSIGAWFYSKNVDKRLKAQLAKQEERINIRLSDGQREIQIGNPRRKWLTRSELNGLLGLLPMKPANERKDSKKEEQPRYVFNSINWTTVEKQIEKAQDGETNGFVVQCTTKELNQFKDNVIKKIN